jgi:hypothetical protein
MSGYETASWSNSERVNRYFWLALLSLAVWIVLAFGMAMPSGFVHIFLALGVVLIAVGIVHADEGRRSPHS